MRVAVIGAGLSGVTTAWELALAGHHVTVLERHAGVAEEASFAPTGLASVALAMPWAAPPSPWKAFFSRHAGASALWRWRQARNRRPDSWQPGAAALARLLALSVERAEGIPAALRFDCERSSGLLVLLHQGDDLGVARANVDWLASQGVAASWVDPEALRAVEPSLALRTSVAGGVHLPGARHTNVREFVQGLRSAARGRGVRFISGREVVALQPAEGGSLVRLAPRASAGASRARGGANPADTSRMSSAWSAYVTRFVDDGDEGVAGDVLECDAIVVCANLGARALLAPLGVHLPVAAMPGTSVTVSLHAHEAQRDPGPQGSVLDARTGIAICRQGARARLAGGFDATGGGRPLAGNDAEKALYRSLDRWFPGAARWPTAQAWHGERATLPDGLPLLGPARHPGLFLNLAHGHHGWAVACGAALSLAEMVSGREPPVDLAAFAPARLG